MLLTSSMLVTCWSHVIHLVTSYSHVHKGCPANTPAGKVGPTPQKIARMEGHKDALRELKKLSLFQDKVARGIKPKGHAEPWAVKVWQANRHASQTSILHAHIIINLIHDTWMHIY